MWQVLCAGRGALCEGGWRLPNAAQLPEPSSSQETLSFLISGSGRQLSSFLQREGLSWRGHLAQLFPLGLTCELEEPYQPAICLF